MSAKDAPGEVENKNIFGSPNISASEDEEIIKPEVDKEAEEQKKRETVNIDGVPIDKKDIKYRAADIRKKQKMKYFVHVTDASKYEKQAARRKALAKRAAEHRAAEEKREAEREEKEAATAAAKKQAEEKQHIDDVNKYIEHQKTERARSAKKAKKAEERSRFRKYRIIIIAVAAIALIAVIVAIVLAVINGMNSAEDAERRRQEEEAEAKSSEAFLADKYMQISIRLDTDTDIENYFKNYQFDDIDRIYDEFVEKLDKDSDKGKLFIDKMQRILRYAPDEYDEIVKAAERAYSYAPNNSEIVDNVVYAYEYAGQIEKANELKKVLDKLRKEELEKIKQEGDGEEHAG